VRHERQVELLERVAAAGTHLQGLHAPASVTNPAAAYTDAARFDRELDVLFRRGPTFLALSCELPEPGDFVTATTGGVPIVAVRQPDGSLRAMVNICRHRGAPLVAAGSTGTGLRSFTCPYHGWVYDADGTLRGRPMSAGAFDDVALECNLIPVSVAEQYGLVFVRARGTSPIDVDAYLGGAQDDLGAFGLDGYVLIDRRTRTWRMNWKLVLDTFSESYHIRTLHKESLLPRFNADCVIFEPFGRNLVSIGLRKDVLDETSKPKDQWSLLPYGTIQYFLVPSGLVVHQIDHVETWRVEPIDVRTSRLVTAVYGPRALATDRARDHWLRNLDLLLDVTGTEDFPLMEAIQANLDTGVLPAVIYGRNEPPLIHYHRSVEQALAEAEPT
jgi:phenylpropionate dioxygenase-like ring-hydroxylating dioxygenase large terminal subunit